MKNAPFSIAALLADRFVTSKLTQLMILGCLMLGWYALSYTPREDNPQIIVPGASIQVELPGASSAEVEQLLVRPLESAIRQIPGIDDFYSTALNSVALLTVQFDVGEDQEKSLVKLLDRINAAKAQLPADAGEPLIRSVNVDDVPIVTITLASEHYNDFALKRLADRMLDGLRSMQKVSTAYVQGGRDREIRVELNPDRMQGFDITLDQVRRLLTAANVSAPLGNVVQHGKHQQVFLDGYLENIEELRKLVVAIHASRPIYLGDIAQIIDAPLEERTSLSRLGFGLADPRHNLYKQPDVPAVTIAIAKQRGTNAVVVAQEVIQRIEQMQARFVPKDVEVIITRDDGKIADDTVNELIHHLGIAILAVFLVTLVFLGGKEALIVGMSVPLVLALTLGIGYLSGLTINRVSLFGLIIALGLLVDDAIVVIENIHRNYSQKPGPTGSTNKRSITVESAGEIGNPTNLATIAVMLVFGSLTVVTGMPGEYFYPIAFSVPVAMASSLLIAYTVVPWAAYRWLKPEGALNSAEENDPAIHSQHNANNRLSKHYRRILTGLLQQSARRRWALIAALGLIALSLLQPAWQFIRPAGISGPQAWFGVQTTMMPQNNKNTFNITIDMPEYSPIEDTDHLSRKLAQVLRQHPHVTNYQIWLGQSGILGFNGMLKGTASKAGPYVAEIRVNLRHKDQRDITSMAIVRELRPKLQTVAAQFPGAVIQLLEDPPGPPVKANLLAEIYGPDLQQLRSISKQVTEQFKQTWDVAEVNDSEPADVTQYRLLVDREKAALSGLTTAEVVTAMRRLIDGEYLGRAHIHGEKNPVPVQLLIPRRHQLDIGQLSRAYVTNSQQVKIPLSELVHVKRTNIDRPIHHKNGARVSFVLGEMQQTAPIYAVLDLNQRLQGLSLKDGSTLRTGNLGLTPEEVDSTQGYTLLWDGSQRQMLDTYRDMMGALAISITLIYFILVAYYQSFSLPLVAMAAIPLGLAGVFPGHWLMQVQFSATSMVGVIALAGVVIRNSLLIIDFVLEYQGKGLSQFDAIVEAGAVRLRPILLTALAIVLGSAIMLTDPLFSGLAISLIFGTIAATALTLIIIPVLLHWVLSWKAKRNRTYTT
jgi:multidrug efflux pump subunit AcrB